MRIGTFFLVVAAGVLWGATALNAHELQGDLFVHDPSTIVRCNEDYWLFATGRGIKARRSRDLFRWESAAPVFATPPAWTSSVVPGNDGLFWAPDAIRLNDQFLLCYSVSKWGSQTSAIGLAVNRTLDPQSRDFGWKDAGIVIQSRKGDDFNAIDPCITHGNGGTLWLAFGSYWTGIKLVQLNPTNGLRIAPDSPIHSLAYHSSIEAPYLHRHGGYYYLFVNWGECCRGVRSTYNIRVGRSRKITGPYLDRDGKDMLREGGSLFLQSDGPFIGPGHAGVVTKDGKEWFTCHYYDARKNGRGTLDIEPLDWTADGWPVVDRDRRSE